MKPKIEQTKPKQTLSLGESALYAAFNAVTIENKTPGEALNLTGKQILPKYIVITDGSQLGDITLPDPITHEGNAIYIVNDDANEAVLAEGVSCPFGTLSLIYSDGTQWVRLFSILTV